MRDERKGELETLLKNGQSALVFPNGRSMRPIISPKSAVVLKRAEIKRGDIALYKTNEGEYILHRVIRFKKNGSVVMCGDRSAKCEEIMPEALIAKAVMFERRGKMLNADNPLLKLWSAIWCVMPLRRSVLWLLNR